MKRYFITGTDTDCGKTYVTATLLQYLKQQDKKALAIKPVASGCSEEGSELISADALYLSSHNGDFPHEICPWRLRLPISPHLAAEHDGVTLSAHALADFCQDEKFSEFDYLLVEGAGGLLVPLNAQETWVDFLKYSKMPVILVVGMRLGCINHALLTALALKQHDIECAGWIANCLAKDMRALSENIKTLTDKMQPPLLATIPYDGLAKDVTINKHIFCSTRVC